MNYQFRLANKSDLNNITKIFSNAIQDMEEKGIDQWDSIYPNSDIIRDDIENKQMYVLICNNRLVSAIVINEQQDPEYQAINWTQREGNVCIIHRMCVDPTVQGKGFGKKTVSFAEAKVLENNYSIIRLDAFSKNPFAIHLYETLNYKCVGEVQFRKGKFYCYEKILHK
ncbi:acetyltransferase domain protein [Clostridium argentinense CDC 2741]|uniref:Acetyltransferase domain protein n=1 Tax=Clostridium argentinense CDC 2741 TaxID=1418104 RepID=A0A0C1R2B4_9CLOT|nr:GNAT family N-acetyltransferase [Clostridium argentinense]ARC84121.1 GNAT family N-acetyltransferase [Clostridium argentinense]KIE44596.1 acetyltransferase domain protein [Clostridium argentinense CDC 2741]NFF39274.1 GNAT family N-acetyltransferase [Clostridium argentinense]NFP51483.1 GNAT family N-acetyltransferase [Clostridium argentinense]NFP74330.1 GNAT family N-acetyltransferase [Clostridium argentinense]